MKRTITLCVLSLLFLAPMTAQAHPRHGGGHRHGGRDAAVAWGIVGGIVAGVVLDQVLSPPRVIMRDRVYYEPAPHYDPYRAGYVRGFERGQRDAQRRRYRAGAYHGYADGVAAGYGEYRY